MAARLGALGNDDVAAQAAVEEAAASAGRSISPYGVAFGIVVAAIATGSGYYLSMLGVTDTVTGLAAGGGVGAVLGLAVMRWTMRARS